MISDGVCGRCPLSARRIRIGTFNLDFVTLGLYSERHRALAVTLGERVT
jgi:hypothetical protein